MTNKKFEHLATLCDCLAKNASTPEQRENLIGLAERWRRRASGQGGSEPDLDTAHRAAVRSWLRAMPETPKPWSELAAE